MIDHLTRLAETMSAESGLSHWQIGLKATGSAKFFRDLKAGRRKGCTVATYGRVLQWFSDQWPADLAWPTDIPRPAASAGSPSAEAASGKEAA